MTSVPVLDLVARHERGLVLSALALVTLIGLYTTLHVGDMLMMVEASALGGTGHALLLFIMWWSMMLAMMLPSAAPAILTYATLARNYSRQRPDVVVSPALFASGYALVWTGFSALAVLLQLVVNPWVPLTMMMAVTSAGVGGGLLVAAGLYQLSPLKAACLRKCQSPLIFLGQNWLAGRSGALRMGLQHGLYCVGCCWVLMGLLFYGGVMEPRWIVGLALYVALEKLIPAGERLSHVSGLVLMLWGAATLIAALL